MNPLKLIACLSLLHAMVHATNENARDESQQQQQAEDRAIYEAATGAVENAFAGLLGERGVHTAANNPYQGFADVLTSLIGGIGMNVLPPQQSGEAAQALRGAVESARNRGAERSDEQTAQEFDTILRAFSTQRLTAQLFPQRNFGRILVAKGRLQDLFSDASIQQVIQKGDDLFSRFAVLAQHQQEWELLKEEILMFNEPVTDDQGETSVGAAAAASVGDDEGELELTQEDQQELLNSVIEQTVEQSLKTLFEGDEDEGEGPSFPMLAEDASYREIFTARFRAATTGEWRENTIQTALRQCDGDFEQQMMVIQERLAEITGCVQEQALRQRGFSSDEYIRMFVGDGASGDNNDGCKTQ